MGEEEAKKEKKKKKKEDSKEDKKKKKKKEETTEKKKKKKKEPATDKREKKDKRKDDKKSKVDRTDYNDDGNKKLVEKKDKKKSKKVVADKGSEVVDKDSKKKLKKERKHKDDKDGMNKEQKDKKSSNKLMKEKHDVKKSASNVEKKARKEKSKDKTATTGKKALNDFIKKGKKGKDKLEEKNKSKEHKKEKAGKKSSSKDKGSSSEPKTPKPSKGEFHDDPKQSEFPGRKSTGEVSARDHTESPKKVPKSPKRSSQQSTGQPVAASSDWDETPMKMAENSSIPSPPLSPSNVAALNKVDVMDDRANSHAKASDDESSESSASSRSSASEKLQDMKPIKEDSHTTTFTPDGASSLKAAGSSSGPSEANEESRKIKSTVVNTSKMIAPLDSESSVSSGTSSGSSVDELLKKKPIGRNIPSGVINPGAPPPALAEVGMVEKKSIGGQRLDESFVSSEKFSQPPNQPVKLQNEVSDDSSSSSSSSSISSEGEINRHNQSLIPPYGPTQKLTDDNNLDRNKTSLPLADHSKEGSISADSGFDRTDRTLEHQIDSHDSAGIDNDVGGRATVKNAIPNESDQPKQQSTIPSKSATSSLTTLKLSIGNTGVKCDDNKAADSPENAAKSDVDHPSQPSVPPDDSLHADAGATISRRIPYQSDGSSSVDSSVERFIPPPSLPNKSTKLTSASAVPHDEPKSDESGQNDRLARDDDNATANAGSPDEQLAMLSSGSLRADASNIQGSSVGSSVANSSHPVVPSTEPPDTSIQADPPNQVSKEATIEIDRSSHHVVAPLHVSPFSEVLNECTLEVNHPSQPPVAKKGSFKDYDHSNFRLTADDEEDEETCLSMIAEGKGGKCELRHHTHWGVDKARYSTHRSGVILCSTTLCLGASPDVKDSTMLQVIHTSYEMPSATSGTGKNTLFGKTPLLRITWCRDERHSSPEEGDMYLLWAHLRRREKEQRYKIGLMPCGDFFELDVWIVYDADSEHYELGIDLEEDNRLLKKVDDWLDLTPTSYFQLGCQINQIAGEDEATASDTSIQMLYQKLDINIPTGELIEEEENSDEESDDEDEESDEEDTGFYEEDDSSVAEVSVDSSDNSGWEEKFVSDDESSSSDSGSYVTDDDNEEWAEESVQDSDESSSGSEGGYDSGEEGNLNYDDEDCWAEVPVSDEENGDALHERIAEDGATGWAETPAEEENEDEIIEYYDGSSGSEYSAESMSEVTVHSSGSAYYIGVDESNAKDLSELAERKQIEFVIARKKMAKQENSKGYSKVAVWTDLAVTVYQAVKGACADTRIFVLSKRTKQKIKNGEIVGYITYGTGENVRKVSFAACKKTALVHAIDDVLPVTDTTLPVLISYEEVATGDDDEEELSD